MGPTATAIYSDGRTCPRAQTHTSTVTTLTWSHISYYVYIGIYTDKKNASHTQTHTHTQYFLY